MTTRKEPRILIVEDEWLIAASLAEHLQSAGFRVAGPAGSLSKAQQLLEVEEVDAAVLDITLQDQKSFPLARQLQARGIPYLFVSGYAEIDLPSDFRGALVMTKPVAPDALTAILRELAPS